MIIGVFGCVSLWHCAGCKAPEDTAATMALLKEARFQGHFMLTTDAGAEIGQRTSFFAGARGTRLAVDGNIDFTGPR
jgi:hypothetical protein